MKENIDHMDKAIKEKLEVHEVPVPSHLWNSIQSNLPPVNGTGGGTIFLKTPFIVSILILSTALIGSFFYAKHNSQKKHTHATLDTVALINTENTQNTTTYTRNNRNYVEIENAQNRNTAAKDILSSGQAESATSNSDINIKETDHTNHSIRNNYFYENAIDINNPFNHSGIQELSVVDHKRQHAQDFNKSTQQLSQSTNASATSIKELHMISKVPAYASISEPTKSTTKKTTQSATISPGSKSINTGHKSMRQAKQSSSLTSAGNQSSVKYTATQDKYRTEANNTSNKLISSTPQDNTQQSTLNTDPRKKSISEVSNYNYASSNEISNPNASTLSTEPTNETVAQPTQSSTVHNTEHATSIATNTSHTISAPSATTTQNGINEETNPLHSVDNVNTSTALSLHKEGIDSVNKSIDIENAIYSNQSLVRQSTPDQANPLVYSANQKQDTLLFAVDSSMQVHEIDSISTEDIRKTDEVANKEEQKKRSLFLSKCSIDGYASPALGYLFLSQTNHENSIVSNTKRNKTALTGIGFTTGLRLNYALTQKIEIGIGFQYSNLSQQNTLTQQHLDTSYTSYKGKIIVDSTYDSIQGRVIFSSRYVLTDSTEINTYSSQTKKYTDKYQNISIPIHIAYGYNISPKFSLIARTSLLINFKTYSITHINVSDGSVVGYQSIKNLSMGGSFSIGGYYQFSKACAVFAEPNVSYYFSNLFKNDAPFKQKLLMLGLQTGVRFSF